jgi:hypothetical protein
MPRRTTTGKGRSGSGTGAPLRHRYPEAMRNFRRWRARIGPRAVLAAVAVMQLLAAPPAIAFDLFATHEVTAHFATADGKPMADAEVRVFAPGSTTPVETGRTDAAGKFVFAADRDGMWSAEARNSGEIARIMIRVGGTTPRRRVDPLFLIGGLGLLFLAALWYRFRRLKPRAPKG